MTTMPQNILVTCMIAVLGLAATPSHAAPCGDVIPPPQTIVAEANGFFPHELYSSCDEQKIYVKNESGISFKLEFSSLIGDLLGTPDLLNGGTMLLNSPGTTQLTPFSLVPVPTGERYQCGWQYYWYWRTPKYCNVTEIGPISGFTPGELVLGPAPTSYITVDLDG